MAEIDSLEIKITAESSKAESALDRVISKLESIQSLMKNKGIDNLSNALSGIATQTQKINMDRISNGIRKVSNSSDAMAKRVSKNVDIVAQKNKEAAKEINKFASGLKQPVSKQGMGISAEAAETVKQKMLEIYEAQRKVYDYLYANQGKASKSQMQEWKNAFDTIGHSAEEAISKYSRVKKKIDEVDAAVLEYVKHSKKIGLEGIKDAYTSRDDFREDKKRAGSQFVLGKGDRSITSFLEDLNSEVLDKFNRSLEVSKDGFEELIHIIERARTQYVSFSEDAQSFDASPSQIIKAFVQELTHVAKAASLADAQIRQTADAVRSLMMQGQGIPRIGMNLSNMAENALKMDFTPRINLDNIKMLPAVINEIKTALMTTASEGAGELENKFAITVERVNELIDRISVLKGMFQGGIGGESQPLLTDYHDAQFVDYEPRQKEYFSTLDEDINKIVESYRKANEEQSVFGNFDFGKVSAGLLAVSDILNKIGKGAEKASDFGIRLLGIEPIISRIKGGLGKINLFTPLHGVVEEYKEKLSKIGKHFEDFRNKVQASLKKLSAFWKRVMKTFTFMLVRKAITAIIGEIKEATESLALFSQEMGTAFNENLSNAIADFKWIGKAILGAFEPIINYVVPVLNVLSAALVKVITLLGHFFAAMTGQGYYMVAKKKVDDYAKSLKKAQKQTQLSIRGFDELNNLTTPKSSDSDKENNPAEDWEMKPVSDKMKKFADMIKDLAKTLWKPIERAWDKTKDYVISGFKYMVGELAKLGKSIGRDFLKAWDSSTTEHIFENIFKIVGDIERVIGNLAKRFREAWDEGEKGLHIFENIGTIIDTLVQHIRNVTAYMVKWSDSIDFNPLIESVEKFTASLTKLADFIGGVFYDVMTNVVLKYVQWLIEEGTPHLLHTISEIINAVDWESVRRGLFIIEKAFESLLENVHTGVTNAIGFLGKAVADWLNSEKFIRFMQAIANILNQITAERVEKVLEGLGLAILHIAEAVADFVSSDKFQGFIEKIGEWIDKSSPEDIAAIAESIIGLTAAFKGLAAAIPIIGSLIGTFAKFKIAGDIGKIAQGLSGAGKVAKGAEAAKGAGKVIKFGTQEEVLAETSSLLTKIQGVFGKVAQAAGKTASKITSAFTSINWGTVFTGDIGANMAAGGATAGATFAAGLIASIAAAIGGYNFGKLLGDKFIDKGETGIYKDFKLFDFKNLFSGDVKADLQASFDAVISMFTDFENNPAIATITNVFGALSMPLVTLGVHLSSLAKDGNFDAIGKKFNQIKEDVSGAFSLMGQDIKAKFEPVMPFFEGVKERVSGIFRGLWIIIKAVWITVAGWFKQNVIDPIVAFFKQLWADIKAIWTGVKEWFNTYVVEPVVGFFRGLWETVKGFFTTLWEDIKAIWETVSEWFNTNVVEPIAGFFKGLWEDVKGFFATLWQDIKDIWIVVSEWFNTNIFQPLQQGFYAVVDAVKGFFNDLWEDIKSGVKAAFNFVISVVENAINGIISGLNAFLKGFNFIAGKAAEITKDSWTDIELIPKVQFKRFATGGFPEDGWFRASQGEIMGQFDNGKSVVANNEQIIEGIKAGVIDGMMQILPSLAQAVQSGETTVNIEGDMGKFFKAMVKENGGMNKRTFGSSPLYV